MARLLCKPSCFEALQCLRRAASRVGHGNLRDVDLGERHCLPSNGRLGLVVDAVDEYAHPLISSAVGIDCAAALARRLDLDTTFAGLDGVARVLAANKQIGVPVVEGVDHQAAAVLCHAGCQHVRQHS